MVAVAVLVLVVLVVVVVNPVEKSVGVAVEGMVDEGAVVMLEFFATDVVGGTSPGSRMDVDVSLARTDGIGCCCCCCCCF